MKPILYSPEEREFNSNGLGVLSDAISCVVTWEGNGIFDLTMEYPMDGIHFDKIADSCIIMAIPTPYREPQPFRISRITKNMDGTAEVYAQHVAYDLSGVPVRPFSATGASATLAGLNSNAVTDSGFTFWTDISSSAQFSMNKPASVWSLLGGSEGSVLDVFGGQYEFDRWAVKLHGQLGQDNGVTIRYGKNLTDLEQERNLSYMYTGVYSFWADSDGNYVQCDPAVVPVNGSGSYNNVLVLDLSSEFQDKPTSAQLTDRTRRYITDNNLGKPRVSITLTHEMLEQTDEYAGLSLLERCSVFDTVHVQFEKLGVDATAKIASAETDVLRERYNSLKVGSVEANIADTIAGQQTAIQKRPTITSVQQIATSLAAAVTGANGGAIRLLDKNGDDMPDEFYIANDPDPAKATKVWRFNYEGFLASKNGYNGPYNMIGTFDGFYADAIVAGTLTAIRIQSADGRSSWDLASGAAIFNSDSIQINSKNFVLDSTGNVSITGSFYAQSSTNKVAIQNGAISFSRFNSTVNGFRDTVTVSSAGTTGPIGLVSIYGPDSSGNTVLNAQIQGGNSGGALFICDATGQVKLSASVDGSGNSYIDMGGTGKITTQTLEVGYIKANGQTYRCGWIYNTAIGYNVLCAI